MKKIRILTIIIAVLALTGTSLYSGDPIPGIDITLKNTETKETMKTKTDRNGKFSFKNLDPGKYIIEISYKRDKMIIGNDRKEALVIAPRDAASGLPTGKRGHKPVKITKEIDKSTPLLAQVVCPGGGTGSGMGSTKAQDYNSSRSNTTSAMDIDSDGDKCSPVVIVVVKKQEFRGHVTVLK